MADFSLQDASAIIIAVVGIISVIVIVVQTLILRKQSHIMNRQTQITETQTKIMDAQTRISEFVALSVEPVWQDTNRITVNVKNEGKGVARDLNLDWQIVALDKILEDGTAKMQAIGPSNTQNVEIRLTKVERQKTFLSTLLRLHWSGKGTDDRNFSDSFEIHIWNMRRLDLEKPELDDPIAALTPFLLRWEAKEILGREPSRWLKVETEDRVDLQKSARTLSDQLMQLTSKYHDIWDGGLTHQIQYISEELRKFGTTQPPVSANDLDFTDLEKYGREAYEAARTIVTWLRTKKSGQ